MFDPALPRSRVFLPAIVAGCSYFCRSSRSTPASSAWVALVPLLSLVRANARPRRIYFAAFVGGLLCYVPAIPWMRVAHPSMYAVVALPLVLLRPIPGHVDRAGRAGSIAWCAVLAGGAHRLRLPSSTSDLISRLATRGWRMSAYGNPIGFGWYMLGHTQHDWLTLIQIADLTGVYGFVPGRAGERRSLAQPDRPFAVRVWLRAGRGGTASVRPGRSPRRLWSPAVVYGHSAEPRAVPDGPQVALIQGNLPQSLKNTSDATWRDHFGRLRRRGRPRRAAARLVIWPETSFRPLARHRPRGTFRLWPRVAAVRQLTREVAGESDRLEHAHAHRSELLSMGDRPTGMEVQFGPPDRRRRQPLARYDKIHLVPFGEYVPLESACRS